MSIMREYKWPPSVLEGLFFDREDYFGTELIWEDLIEMYKEKPKPVKPKGNGK